MMARAPQLDVSYGPRWRAKRQTQVDSVHLSQKIVGTQHKHEKWGSFTTVRAVSRAGARELR